MGKGSGKIYGEDRQGMADGKGGKERREGCCWKFLKGIDGICKWGVRKKGGKRSEASLTYSLPEYTARRRRRQSGRDCEDGRMGGVRNGIQRQFKENLSLSEYLFHSALVCMVKAVR